MSDRVRDKLELLQLFYPLILAGITDVCHHAHTHDAIHRAGLGQSTRVSCMLGKVSTNGTTSPVLPFAVF